MALHAGSADARSEAFDAVAHARRARRERVQRRRERDESAAAVYHGPKRGGEVSTGEWAVGVGARSYQRRTRRRRYQQPHGDGPTRCQRRRRESRRCLFASHVPTRAETEYRLSRVCDPDVWNRKTSGHRRHESGGGDGDDDCVGRPGHSGVSLLSPLVLSHRLRRRLRVSRAAVAAQAFRSARRHERHGRAGSGRRSSRNHRCAAQRHPATRRRAARAFGNNARRGSRGVWEVRRLGQAVSAAVSNKARRVSQSACGLWRHRHGWRSIDRAADLRALARCYQTFARRASRSRCRSRTLAEWVESRSALSSGGRFRHRRGPNEPGRLHGSRVAAGRWSARGQSEDSLRHDGARRE